MSPETRARISDAQKAKWADPAYRAAALTRLRSPENRAKSLAGTRRYWGDKSSRDRFATQMIDLLRSRGYWACPLEHKRYYDKMVRHCGIPKEAARAAIDKLMGLPVSSWKDRRAPNA